MSLRVYLLFGTNEGRKKRRKVLRGCGNPMQIMLLLMGPLKLVLEGLGFRNLKKRLQLQCSILEPKS